MRTVLGVGILLAVAAGAKATTCTSHTIGTITTYVCDDGSTGTAIPIGPPRGGDGSRTWDVQPEAPWPDQDLRPALPGDSDDRFPKLRTLPGE